MQTVRQLKSECEGLLRRQELQYEADKQMLKDRVHELERQVKDMKSHASVQHSRSNPSLVMQIPASEVVEEDRVKAKYASHDVPKPPKMSKKKADATKELHMQRAVMESELVKLVEENQRLGSQNEDLSAELDRIRNQSMEHLSCLENELQQKYISSGHTE